MASHLCVPGSTCVRTLTHTVSMIVPGAAAEGVAPLLRLVGVGDPYLWDCIAVPHGVARHGAEGVGAHCVCAHAVSSSSPALSPSS